MVGLEPSARSFFSQIVSETGHEVVCAAAPSEGIRLLSLTPFELVFLDLAVGVETALEVMVQAREDGVPVVAVPGIGPDRSEIFRPTTFGAVAVLAQPLNADEIRCLVSMHAGNRTCQDGPSA